MKHDQQGVTLLEVLITVVILSLGLLGLASLASVSLMQTHASALRSLSVLKISDMSETIRLSDDGGEAAMLYLQDWNDEISTLLPGGEGTVDLSPDGDAFVMSVSWTEREAQVDEGEDGDVSVVRESRVVASNARIGL